jgi:hypothetical protein
MKGFLRAVKFYTVIFVLVMVYVEGGFAKTSEFLEKFRPKTAIAPVSDFTGLEGARVNLFGLEVQGKHFIDDDLFRLELGRILQESGHSTHALTAYCSTQDGQQLFGGEKACLSVTSENALEIRLAAEEEQKAAIEAAGCHRKRGIKFTPWSKEKRRKKCREEVVQELYR